MWHKLAEGTAARILTFASVPDGHPVWSARPYKVFLYSPADVRRIIDYIERNPVKEGLPPQQWPFVTPYDGWPRKRK